MGMPEMIVGGLAAGGLMKANAQQTAGAYQAQNLKLQGQQAQTKIDTDAAAVEASAEPALATARAADYNAQIAKDQAALTLQLGAEEESRYRQASSDTLATGRAAVAASGVEVSGSALDVLASNAQNAELNALTMRHSALVQANSYLNAQTMDQFQSAQASAQAAYIQSNAAYIRSTSGSTAGQYAIAARAAAQTGTNQSVATLLDTGTKIASSGAAGNVADDFGSYFSGPSIGVP